MTSNLRKKWLFVALTIAITYPIVSLAKETVVVIEDARHLKAFYEKGRFAGWPANNGIWQWGNEILVGFSLGYLASPDKQGLHQIDPDRPRTNMLARSPDGGETWSVSEAGYPDGGLKPFPTDIVFDASGFALTARGDKAFISLDRGRTWNGPFRLPFADLHLRARTDYQVLGPKDLMLFLTAQKTNDREGRPFCVRTRTGGTHFNQFAWIGREPPSGYSIMPSSIRLPNGDFLVALRRRDSKPEPHNFIELFRSRDGGLSFQWLANPVKKTANIAAIPPPWSALPMAPFVSPMQTATNRTLSVRCSAVIMVRAGDANMFCAQAAANRILVIRGPYSGRTANWLPSIIGWINPAPNATSPPLSSHRPNSTKKIRFTRYDRQSAVSWQ
ncbi:MAG: hypothetical protein ACYSSN_00990 [Planctomycetota bacterium]|jgi:hypothetical protein